MKILLFADKHVGTKIVDWLYDNYKSDIACLITASENDLYDKFRSLIDNVFIFENSCQIISKIQTIDLEFDFGFLAWWPNIIPKEILNLPKNGFINTHPSFLPHNRGKNYNFWTLVEQSPFGVSLHFAEKGIDSGDIIAQKIIPYTWEDNGQTLYEKASLAMIDLFKDTYPSIRARTYQRKSQDLSAGSFHLAKEMDQASHIDLEKSYKARDLLNLLRARTFPGHPACWFTEGPEEFEVQIQIIRKYNL